MKYDLEKILEELNKDNRPLKVICKELGYPYKYISGLLVKKGIRCSTRYYSIYNKDLIYRIYEEFTSGKTLIFLTKKYNIDAITLKNNFKSYGLPITHRCKLDPNLNHNFFKIIDSEEKAYLLGFFAADGTINKHDNGMAILVQAEDKQILDYYKTAFNDSKNYYFYPAKKSTHKDRLKIEINSYINKQNLINLGFPCRKTYEMFSLPSSIMEKAFYRHFIRGYFDGDGSIILPTPNSRNTVFKITSSNVEFLLFCKDIFESLGCYNITIENRSNNLSRNLVVKNKKSIILIRDYLYNNSSYFLKRKQVKINNVALPISNNRVINS